MVRHHHRFGEALRFIVYAARTHRIDVPPVRLGLWMNLRIAVDLGRRCEQVTRPLLLRDAERLVGAQTPDLQRLDRQLEVVDGTGGAGEVEHAVERPLHEDVIGDVVLDEMETGPAEQVCDVVGRTGYEVIHADDFVTLGKEAVAEMRAEEAGRARDEYPHEPEFTAGFSYQQGGAGNIAGLQPLPYFLHARSSDQVYSQRRRSDASRSHWHGLRRARRGSWSG